jgi:outer membrane protein assembly factor BamB
MKKFLILVSFISILTGCSNNHEIGNSLSMIDYLQMPSSSPTKFEFIPVQATNNYDEIYSMRNGNLMLNKLPFISASQSLLIDNEIVIFFDEEGYLVKKHNNNILWKKFFTQPCLNWGISRYNDIILGSCGTEFLAAFSFIDGSQLWSKEFDYPLQSIPLIANNHIYIQSKLDSVYCLNLNGEVQWAIPSLNKKIRSIFPGKLYYINDLLLQQFNNGAIRLINPKNGETINSLLFNSYYSIIQGSNFINQNLLAYEKNGDIYGVIELGKVIKFNIDMTIKWQLSLPVSKSIWIYGNVIYFIDDLDRLYCVNKQDGTIIWSVSLEQYVTTFMDKLLKRKLLYQWISPIIVENKIMVISSLGYLLMLNPENGQLLSKNTIVEKVYDEPIFGLSTILRNNEYLTSYQISQS